MASFELVSDYRPTGDQPEAIAALVEGFRSGRRYRTLEGVTGSGKTFTMANVIAQLGSLRWSFRTTRRWRRSSTPSSRSSFPATRSSIS